MPHPLRFHPSSLRLGLAFGLALGLAACSRGAVPAQGQAPPAPNDLASRYPYEPGVDYSWSDAQPAPAPGAAYAESPWRGLTLQAQGEPTDEYLSDRQFVSASSGYGPIEKDRSNNTRAGGDGQTLTIGGVTFAKGWGVHAKSELTYALNGACSLFTAQVGVDDEVGDLGSVVFQLWSGATLIYDSGRLTGRDPARAVSVDLNGVQTLRMVVTDAGDGISYDHADWADAKVRCVATQPSGEKFLSEMAPLGTPVNGYGPYENDRSNGERPAGDGRPLTINGTVFSRGLGTHANSDLVYDLQGGNCSVFTAQVGVDDEVGDRGSVIFRVYGDTELLFDSGIMTGRDPARAVNVSVAGKARLRLVVNDAGDGVSYDHSDWASAKISCSVVTPEVTSVTVNPSTVTLSVNGTQQLNKDVQGKGAYTSDVTWTTSNAAVATVSAAGLVTATGAGTATITATSQFDPSKSGSAQVTVNPPFNLPPDGIRINFQPAGSAVPFGYTADTGAAYDDTRGSGWVREDSLDSVHTPLDVTPNARDRGLVGVDGRLNTFMHLQFPTSVNSATAVKTPAAWEYRLPNGVYSVTVGVGDAANNYDSTHQINIEGQLAIAAFQPAATRKFAFATLRANVTDGRLTVDARGGTNTKLDYVIIRPGDRPSVRNASPQEQQTMVATTTPVTADVNLPNSAIDLSTLTPSAVHLIDAGTGMTVNAALNTSGGGDVIVLQPAAPLQGNTVYTFEVTADLKDTSGKAFLPLRYSFVTGPSSVNSGGPAFEQVALPNVPAMPYTAVEMGPDNKLYAATLTGEILRFGVFPDGTLDTPQIIRSVQAANGGPRTIIGFKFDPAATADSLILWISNNYFWDGRTDAPDWSGKITRLSGPNLETVQDYVVGLPRSIRDHATNSISFKPGEPNILYVLQGSNSAMGAPDTAWGNRPERLLNAALLRVDLNKITSPPLSVQTGDGGLYDPYAPGAPVTLYATGIRNAYDMVWHTNGQLYVPTNGSAAGGNTPGTPATLPAACQTRADGPYTGPSVPALTNVGVQHDFLFRVQPGAYYGHPNPLRCQWVMNGGNPTSGVDRSEVPEYPVGTQPDRTWGGFSYDFGDHASANGVIEEYTSAPTSALRNKLLVVRYSAGKDIIVLTPGGPSQDIVQAQTFVTGLTNFNPSPLDLTENRTSGHIYVAQLDERTGSGTLTLVRLK